jgi:actin-related protein
VQSDAYERQIVVGGNYFIDGPRTNLALNIIRQTFPNISSVRPSTFLLMAFSGAW